MKRNIMRSKYSWFKIGLIVFLVLFAFEPVMGFSDIYLNIMLLLTALIFIIFISSIILVFKGNFKMISSFVDSRIMSAISILGLVISHIYDSNLFKFWLFILAMNLIEAFFQFCSKEKK